MQIDFHPVTTADADLVWQYTRNADRRNCDLSFVNLFAWQTLYRTQVGQCHKMLVFRFLADGHPAYMMPIGQGNLQKAIQALKEDAQHTGHPFLMLGVCQEFLHDIQNILGPDIHINPNRDHADYLYLRTTLATLTGKKLQPKRNHINRFHTQYPDYQYEELTPADIPQCLNLARQWAAQRPDGGNEHSVKEEQKAIQRTLTNYSRLPLRGGLIRCNNQIAAFTYGAPICHDTFDICVEKADTRYTGAYAVINQEFVRRLPQQFIYINREEDLGLPGLRKAKLSYQPHTILMKYSVWIPTDDTTPTPREIKRQTHTLWQKCFDDTQQFTDLYFTHKYTPDRNTYIIRRNNVVSALQRLPYNINFCNTPTPVAYISGVCTHPDLRNQGLATQLIKTAHRQIYHTNQTTFALLIPAHNSLQKFYTQTGYHFFNPPQTPPPHNTQQPHNTTYITYRTTQHTPLNNWTTYINRQLTHIPNSMLQTTDDIHMVCADLFLSGGCAVQAHNPTLSTIQGLLFAVPAEKSMTVIECFADTQQIARQMIQTALHTLNLPPDTPTVKQQNTVGVRVINATNALKTYTHTHPHTTLNLHIQNDTDIPQNNGYYTFRNGQCTHTQAPEAPNKYTKINIEQLPTLLFTDGNPYLSMMNN